MRVNRKLVQGFIDVINEQTGSGIKLHKMNGVYAILTQYNSNLSPYCTLREVYYYVCGMLKGIQIMQKPL